MNESAPLHLHKTFEAGPETVCEVHLDQKAEVYLMDLKNYNAYLKYEEFSAFGGPCEVSPARLRPDKTGEWHLVIQQDEKSGSELTVRVQMISEKSAQSGQPKAKPARGRKTKQGPLPEMKLDILGGSSFVIQVDKVRKMFNKSEMNSIIHMVTRGKNPLARRRLLFSFFEKERQDFITENGITDDESPLMNPLVDLIINTFTPTPP